MKTSVAQRRLGGGELVRVEVGHGRPLPTAFTWRGRRYRIRALEEIREDRRTGPRGEKRRRLYQVRTEGGLRAVLCQQPAHNRWSMEAVLGRQGA